VSLFAIADPAMILTGLVTSPVGMPFSDFSRNASPLRARIIVAACIAQPVDRRFDFREIPRWGTAVTGFSGFRALRVQARSPFSPPDLSAFFTSGS
jgi:hypothetical protein